MEPTFVNNLVNDGDEDSLTADPFFCPTPFYTGAGKSPQLVEVFDSEDFKSFLRDLCGELPDGVDIIDFQSDSIQDIGGDFLLSSLQDSGGCESFSRCTSMIDSLPSDENKRRNEDCAYMSSDDELDLQSCNTSSAPEVVTSSHRQSNTQSLALLTARKEKLREFPSALAEAFNIGDIDKLGELICDVMCDHCVFKSPASDKELEGRQHIIDFYSELSKDYPDGVMAVKDVTWINRKEFRFRRYFHGTLIVPKMEQKLYSRNSIMHHLKLSKFSTEDIRTIARKEKECSESEIPIRVFVKSEGRLLLNRSYLVKKYTIEYTVTSFEEVASAKVLVSSSSDTTAASQSLSLSQQPSLSTSVKAKSACNPSEEAGSASCQPSISIEIVDAVTDNTEYRT
jgi:hypothetical protein